VIDRKQRTANDHGLRAAERDFFRHRGDPRCGRRVWPLAMARELDDAVLMLRTK